MHAVPRSVEKTGQEYSTASFVPRAQLAQHFAALLFSVRFLKNALPKPNGDDGCHCRWAGYGLVSICAATRRRIAPQTMEQSCFALIAVPHTHDFPVACGAANFARLRKLADDAGTHASGSQPQPASILAQAGTARAGIPRWNNMALLWCGFGKKASRDESASTGGLSRTKAAC